MAAMQTVEGIDVDMDLIPDTPAEWTRVSRKILTAVDRLIPVVAAFDPDWQIDISLGPTTHLTATPATTTNGDPS